MKPAEELRAAAKLLRERAAELTQGAWKYQPGPPRAEVVAEEGGWIIATSLHIEDDDLRWMALMGPDKAELLAVWLETEASCAGLGETVGKDTSNLLDAIAKEPLELRVTVVADTAVPALAFARAILGAAS